MLCSLLWVLIITHTYPFPSFAQFYLYIQLIRDMAPLFLYLLHSLIGYSFSFLISHQTNDIFHFETMKRNNYRNKKNIQTRCNHWLRATMKRTPSKVEASRRPKTHIFTQTQDKNKKLRINGVGDNLVHSS